jgi:hypothetical protein
VDRDGNLEWLRSYDGGGGDDDAALGVCEAQDLSGYYVVGFYQWGDIWLLKLNEDGDTLWTKHYGEFETFDAGTDIRPTMDGNYVIFGSTASYGGPGGRDFILMKVDPDGNVLWQRLYGTDDDEDGYSVRETRDGGFILVGDTDLNTNDYYVVRVDADGDVIWEGIYGDEGYQTAQDVCETKDGGYAVIGYTLTEGPDFQNPWLLKLDSLGNVMWSRAYHIEGSSWWGAQGWAILETDEGDLVMTGNMDTENGPYIFVLKVDSLGNPLWSWYLGVPAWGRSIRLTSDSGYVIAGKKIEPISHYMYLIKTTPDTGMVVSEGTGVEIPNISLKPTISRGIVWLDLSGIEGGVFYEVYDVMGRRIFKGEKVGVSSRLKLDLSILPVGVYFIKLSGRGIVFRRKFLIIK